MPEVIGKDLETGQPVRMIVSETIKEESWLNDPRFAWFVKGHQYASHQTRAIDALSKVTPEELYFAVAAIIRGANRAGLSPLDC